MSNLTAVAVKSLFFIVLLRVFYFVSPPRRNYEFLPGYYASWKNGMFVKHVEELHRIYGPVVRVRPNELHFSTPAVYFAIYPPTSGFTKDPFFYNRGF
ncbi:hypothetical protein BDZ89DRAFT_1148423 [Hymenopellis radicata]|nr:hypothetical protein BDZ89DRAFT_1148423 [Hymenopellis radicata]